jgi:hypothetical protein
VLIEPHIPARLGIANDTIRFQGCRAARHPTPFEPTELFPFNNETL